MGKHRWPVTGDSWAPDERPARRAPDTQRLARDAEGVSPGHPFTEDDPADDGADDRADDCAHDLADDPGDRHSHGVSRGQGVRTHEAWEDQESEEPTAHSTRSVALRRGAASWEPGADEDDGASQPGIRWGVARSAALVFLGVALAVGAGLFLVRSSEPSAAAVTVQLESDTQRSEDEAAPGTEEDDAGGSERTPADTPANLPGATAPASVPGGGAPPSTGSVVVYVTGAVTAPGVVTAPEGTRLVDILDEVGGALPEADLVGVNLAGTPVDGEHIHVLAVGETPRPEVGGGDSPSAPVERTPGSSRSVPGSVSGTAEGAGAGGGTVNINTATLAEIESLPGVGPVLGQRIIDWRDTNGPFARPADIDAVPGIGPALLEGLLPVTSTQ